MLNVKGSDTVCTAILTSNISSYLSMGEGVAVKLYNVASFLSKTFTSLASCKYSNVANTLNLKDKNGS